MNMPLNENVPLQVEQALRIKHPTLRCEVSVMFSEPRLICRVSDPATGNGGLFYTPPMTDYLQMPVGELVQYFDILIVDEVLQP